MGLLTEAVRVWKTSRARTAARFDITTALTEQIVQSQSEGGMFVIREYAAGVLMVLALVSAVLALGVIGYLLKAISVMLVRALRGMAPRTPSRQPVAIRPSRINDNAEPGAMADFSS